MLTKISNATNVHTNIPTIGSSTTVTIATSIERINDVFSLFIKFIKCFFSIIPIATVVKIAAITTIGNNLKKLNKNNVIIHINIALIAQDVLWFAQLFIFNAVRANAAVAGIHHINHVQIFAIESHKTSFGRLNFVPVILSAICHDNSVSNIAIIDVAIDISQISWFIKIDIENWLNEFSNNDAFIFGYLSHNVNNWKYDESEFWNIIAHITPKNATTIAHGIVGNFLFQIKIKIVQNKNIKIIGHWTSQKCSKLIHIFFTKLFVFSILNNQSALSSWPNDIINATQSVNQWITLLGIKIIYLSNFNK